MLVSTRNSNASRANTKDIDESFPKEQRLQTRREFAAVLNSGIKSVSDSVVVYAQGSPHHQHRLGIIASKRIGIAVRRNSIKRRIRECFRRLNIPTAIPVDFVCIARKNRHANLTKDVSNCLHKLTHKINPQNSMHTAIKLVADDNFTTNTAHKGQQ